MTLKNSAGTASQYDIVILYDTSNRITSDAYNLAAQQAESVATLFSLLAVYAKASEDSGNVVVIDRRFSNLPILVGDDGKPILLYQFVEAIDETVDYERLQEEFPILSYGQIMGAIAFLRKLAQFNIDGLDIDALEDELIEGNENFQSIILNALADQEVTSVRVDEQDLRNYAKVALRVPKND
jgi:hypothetical protein